MQKDPDAFNPSFRPEISAFSQFFAEQKALREGVKDIYTKEITWLTSKNEKNRQLKLMMEEYEVSECTFQPLVQTTRAINLDKTQVSK